MLPDDVKAALNERLYKNAFSEYQALADWLAGQGYQISKASVRRYGAALEKRLEAVRKASEAAKAMVDSSDETGELASASLSLIQTRMFEFLVQGEEGTADIGDLSKAARALADAARASVTVREERRRTLALAAEAAATAAKRELRRAGQNVSKETLAAIRRDVYGIYDEPQGISAQTAKALRDHVEGRA